MVLGENVVFVLSLHCNLSKKKIKLVLAGLKKKDKIMNVVFH